MLERIRSQGTPLLVGVQNFLILFEMDKQRLGLAGASLAY